VDSGYLVPGSGVWPGHPGCVKKKLLDTKEGKRVRIEFGEDLGQVCGAVL
jgi:hypothetical protein